MAIGTPVAFTQQEDQDNAAATWVMTVDSATAAGDALTIVFVNEDAQATAVTDSKGNTYTEAPDLPNGSAGSNFPSSWTALDTAALTTSDTITVTKAAAGNRPQVAVGLAASGIATSSAIDTPALITATGTGTSMSTGTSAATAQADTLVYGIWTLNDNLAVTAHTNGFTELVEAGTLPGAGGVPHLSVAYKILSVAGTVESTATRAAGAGIGWVAALLPLKGAGGGAPAPRMLGTLGVGT